MINILTHDEIYNNLQNYIFSHQNMIRKYKKFECFYNNKVGFYYKDKIVRNLRLQDEVIQRWLGEDGTIRTPYTMDGRVLYKNSDLTISDILVETTLPKTAVNVLKNYSIGVAPLPDVMEDTQEWIKDFEKENFIHRKEKQIITDMLVKGNAFVKVEKGQDGKADIIIIPPENMIVVPDKYNVNEVGGYIFYYELKDELKNEKYNYIEIYTLDGKIYVHNINSSEPEVIETGLSECNIQHIKAPENDKNNKLYGASIYEGLETTFTEIVIRLTSNSYLFNKVNNPSLISSENFSEIDIDTGEEIVQTGSFYKASDPEGANSTRYIEPPTNHVTAIYEHINLNMKNAYSQLGVNEISLGLAQGGNIASGEAFKKAITPTLNKCRDIVSDLYIPLINIYKQAYKIENNADLSIEIKFNDGIALSEREIIENESLLINNKILARKTILSRRGYTEQEAEEEIKKIIEEEKALMLTIDTIEDEDID